MNLFIISTLYSRSREQPIFLQLKDYFWVKTPSAYELPFGTKGSGKLLVSSVDSSSLPLSFCGTKGSGKLMGCPARALFM